jgi:aspartate carbamoyltransferase regulatory subunit
LQSIKSQKYGCKDLIKIEGETLPERLDVLGYLDSQITLIVIRNGKVVKKYHPVPPQKLVNVIKCKNPRCITSIETNCDHIFELSPSGRYRCLYCNQEMPVGTKAAGH